MGGLQLLEIVEPGPVRLDHLVQPGFKQASELFGFGTLVAFLELFPELHEVYLAEVITLSSLFPIAP